MKARFFIAMLLLVGLVALSPSKASAQPATGSLIFEVTGSGKLSHFESVTFGTKPFVTTIRAADIIACIQHDPSAIGCNGTTIEQNLAGQAYLIIEDLTTAWITTQANCTQATVLTGLVGGNGAFMFSGTHALSNTQFIAQGKVKFAKSPPNPQFTPVSITGATIKAVSEDHQHYAIGTFKTVVAAGTCP
jgi:hypothetical protein